ncbi:uncharacterized protein LOC127241627 [Andrographis paniculata]|uniref:uncharacterized protein LOC127241627 n=1 Tax=Andrographis paniculata TaxID=175694 RepID=UPI0021E7055D|nr:uncharacterized protein LOC127241627 [Andrographis paniculata]
MKLPEITEEQIKLQVFPFSLKDATKDWLFNLSTGSVTTWMDMKRASSLKGSFPNTIDAASGGALMNKTLREAWELLNDKAMNSQKIRPRDVVGVKEATKVSSPLQQQLNELTTFVRKLVVGNSQVKPCGICASVEHFTDACPTLTQEVEVNAAGFAQRRAYDPYSNTYNLGWRDHPNFRYANQNQQSFGQQQPPGFQPPVQQQQQWTMPQAPSPSNSLHDIVKSIASNFLQLQQETRTSIKNLEDQMSQVVEEVREMKERERGKLPAQTHMNPSNVSSMVLRSGKELEGPKVVAQKERAEEEIEKEIEQEANKLAKPAKSDKDKEIMEFFKKVELTIPLLDAIKQVPRYAKFLKELCTKKHKLRGDEKVLDGGTVSTVLQRKLPQKCRDPDVLNQNVQEVFEVGEIRKLQLQEFEEFRTKLSRMQGIIKEIVRNFMIQIF